MKIILLNHVNFTTKYCDFWNKLEKYTKLKSLTNVCEDVVNNNIVYHHYYCVDRTETRPYNGMFQFDTTNYIMPKLYYDNITLEQCIADRCAEIVNKNKKIILMYSGGVDSICFLVGFIKNYGYDFCREKMIVCANEQSIEGHSLFYEKFIRDKFELLSSTDSNITLADKTYRDTVIVNGDPANLFDGAVLLEKIMRMNIGLDDKNWKQEIKNNYAHLFGLYHPNAYEHLMDVIESSANSRNYSVDNMFDFIWWYNNNLLYMAHSLNMLRYNYHMLNNNKLGKEYWFNRFIPFFQTDKFTLWAYNKKQEILEDKLTEKIYKKHFKEYIKDFTGIDLKDYQGNAGFQQYLMKGRKEFTFLTNEYVPL
jgi:hypothetical protein